MFNNFQFRLLLAQGGLGAFSRFNKEGLVLRVELCLRFFVKYKYGGKVIGTFKLVFT